MVVGQGDIWWAEPVGSAPGYRRPVLVVQCDAFNGSRIATIVCVTLTSQLKWQHAPGNVLLTARATGLDRDSVANVSSVVTLDRAGLSERVGRVSDAALKRVLDGFCAVVGR